MGTNPDPNRRMLLRAAVAAPFAGRLPPVAAPAAPAAAPAVAPLFCHLADLAIAGGPHHGLAQVLGKLPVGEVLHLAREPDNPHDPFAVAVHHASGLKLGYMPRDLSQFAARLLDAGIPLRIEAVGTLFADQFDPLTEALLRFTSFQDGDPHLRLLADNALLAEKIERDVAATFTRVQAEMAAAEAPPPAAMAGQMEDAARLVAAIPTPIGSTPSLPAAVPPVPEDHAAALSPPAATALQGLIAG